MVEDNNTQMQAPTPDPAFKRFEKLIGKWELKGLTLNAKEDIISGWFREHVRRNRGRTLICRYALSCTKSI